MELRKPELARERSPATLLLRTIIANILRLTLLNPSTPIVLIPRCRGSKPSWRHGNMVPCAMHVPCCHHWFTVGLQSQL